MFFFFFSSRRRHTRCGRDWSSDVCSSDLEHDEQLLMDPLEILLVLELVRDSVQIAPRKLAGSSLLHSGRLLSWHEGPRVIGQPDSVGHWSDNGAWWWIRFGRLPGFRRPKRGGVAVVGQGQF